MDCKTLHFSRHAFERMFQRGINPDVVTQIIAEGEVIANYSDDLPFPSVLLLSVYGKAPVHAVIARDPTTGSCYLVTIYLPDSAIWDESFKKRRT